MRLRFLIPGALVVVGLVAGAGLTAHAASDRQASFASAAAALRTDWDSKQSQGLPAAVLAPLRSQLDSQGPSAPAWSPSWFGDDGQALLERLRGATDAAWSDALNTRRAGAQAVMAAWNAFASAESTWIDPSVRAAAAQWPDQLASASSPAAIVQLMSTWQADLTTQKGAVAASQKARLESELSSAGGPQLVIATAMKLVAIATSANLDAGNTATLAATLQGQLDGGGSALSTADQLLAAVRSLQALISLNNRVAAQLPPLLSSINEVAAVNPPAATPYLSQYAAISSQFRSARTSAQLTSIAQAAATLAGQVNVAVSNLSPVVSTPGAVTGQCGAAVGTGKVITMNLTLQEMVFYQDGCVVRATPITTGRPQLRTPTGTFHIFYKTSPFTFISPWPKGSPFYYYPSRVSWVMEFASGGFFIHDAPWESAGAYGPGSENNLAAASHGCVHVPTPVMAWAYAWTPMGTPVVISA